MKNHASNNVNPSTHENFTRSKTVAASSDRAFGSVFAGFLAIISLLSIWHGNWLWIGTSSLAALFLAGALIYPRSLNRLNRIWFKFGLLLHKIVNPVVMAFLFYGTVLPTGLAMRAAGKDLLRLKREPQADSYWIARHPPGPLPESMTEQF